MLKIMTNKLSAIILSIVKSMIYWFGFIMFWLIKEKEMPNYKFYVFFSPFYFLWLSLMIVCVLRTERPMKIFWIGNMRDPDTFSMPNLPYAIIFIIGCVVIAWVQYRYISFYIH